MNRSALTSFRLLASRFQGGARALAQRIGRNPTSLSHELLGTGTAKLGWSDGVELMRASGDTGPLQELCGMFGGMFVQLPDVAAVGDETGAHMAATAKEFADFVQALAERAIDGDISDNDMVVFDREWSELVARGSAFMSHLRARNLVGKVTHLRAA